MLSTSAETHTQLNMHEPNRQVQGKVVLVTGATGGIGRCLTAAFLEAGAREVIATCRQRSAGADPRLTWMVLDLTSRDDIERVAREVGERVDILVNNSGVNANSRLFADSAAHDARQEMAVNYFGLLDMLQAFGGPMRARGSGVIVNMLTVLAHVSHPMMASYCASKAAALSLTQAARAELARHGVRVCAALPPAVDTAMSGHLPGPKLQPEVLAHAIVDAIRDGAEDVYPGMAEELRHALQADSKAVERMFAARLPVQ